MGNDKNDYGENEGKMKVIIAGSRSITDYDLLCAVIKESGYEITEVISGGAKGVDTLGEMYARSNDIKLTIFEADWKSLGLRAGPVRNGTMRDYGDALIALWDGNSSGTKDMIKKMQSAKKPFFLHDITKRSALSLNTFFED